MLLVPGFYVRDMLGAESQCSRVPEKQKRMCNQEKLYNTDAGMILLMGGSHSQAPARAIRCNRLFQLGGQDRSAFVMYHLSFLRHSCTATRPPRSTTTQLDSTPSSCAPQSTACQGTIAPLPTKLSQRRMLGATEMWADTPA